MLASLEDTHLVSVELCSLPFSFPDFQMLLTPSITAFRNHSSGQFAAGFF